MVVHKSNVDFLPFRVKKKLEIMPRTGRIGRKYTMKTFGSALETNLDLYHYGCVLSITNILLKYCASAPICDH